MTSFQEEVKNIKLLTNDASARRTMNDKIRLTNVIHVGHLSDSWSGHLKGYLIWHKNIQGLPKYRTYIILNQVTHSKNTLDLPKPIRSKLAMFGWDVLLLRIDIWSLLRKTGWGHNMYPSVREFVRPSVSLPVHPSVC